MSDQISVKQLKEKLDNEEDFVLIDVRETYEHDEFNVGGKLVPLGELTASLGDLIEAKEKEVVVYCRSGKRSGMAQSLLKQSGFSNVLNLEGGMLAWQEAFGTS